MGRELRRKDVAALQEQVRASNERFAVGEITRTDVAQSQARLAAAQATLADHDWTVNFAEVNHPGDRAAVIVTTPLTTNEQWTAFEPGELKVFVDGLPQ